ncbi:MAG: signal peptidase I [Kofleriaceae bacterium]|nr:signal peptidase I [Kofleriaceae bacterium]
MRAAALDRRVRNEARQLLREARGALAKRPGLTGKAGDLTTVTDEVERALAANDLARVRRALPALDALVDELCEPPGRSLARDYIESIGAAVLIALTLRAFVVEAFKIPSSSMYPTLEIGDHIFVNKFIYGVRVPFSNTKLIARGPERGEVIVFVQPCDPEKDYIKRVVAVAGDTVEVRCNVIYVNGKAIPSALVQGEGCIHDDIDESTGRWFTRQCSRYRETVGDITYDTFHGWDRPRRDAELAETGHLNDGDINDFPLVHELSLAAPSCARDAEGKTLSPAARNQLPGKIVVTRAGLPHTHACEQQAHYVVPARHVFVMGDNRGNSKDSRIWGSVPIENIKGKALFTWLSYSRFSLTDWSGIRFHRIGNLVH